MRISAHYPKRVMPRAKPEKKMRNVSEIVWEPVYERLVTRSRAEDTSDFPAQRP
jgi:hypothetical protein